MSQICANMLGTSPEAQEVTSYVLTAFATVKAQQDPSASEEMKSACRISFGEIETAQELVTGMTDNLHSCWLTDIRIAAIDDCATALLRADDHTPLHRMVLFNRDQSVLTLRLAILLVPNKLGVASYLHI
ncbi:hypothetical protein E2562_038320 [Oryza meyeriana var. granulata]|uniref:Uncharacterized protein n=1 Tax=Oryza meyeriana var. granulata TaxID=110450 RepID=A0A6G1CMA4_9ORYZ|nr:hypothetical protein E2562_038320 [Oryza meyeriana var. granulata]